MKTNTRPRSGRLLNQQAKINNRVPMRETHKSEVIGAAPEGTRDTRAADSTQFARDPLAAKLSRRRALLRHGRHDLCPAATSWTDIASTSGGRFLPRHVAASSGEVGHEERGERNVAS